VPGAGVSAWSVSRTTFFIWLIWRLVVWFRYGGTELHFFKRAVPIPTILFFVGVTISLVPSFYRLADYRYFFLGAMHYLMILDFCSDPKRWRLVFYLIALLPGFLAVRGILYDPLMLEVDQMRRFGYPLPHPNIAGYLFSMTLPLCLAVAVIEKGKMRALALLSGGGQLLALILTYSRGSWLGWLASLFSFGVMLRRWREIWVILTLVGLLLALASPLQERLFSLANPQTDLSINERVQAMQDGLKLGLEHPFLGVGYGRGSLRAGLREQHRIEATKYTHIAHTHNMYIELFAQTGLLGLGAFLWLLCHILAKTFGVANRLGDPDRIFRLGIAAAWIAFIVTGLGDVPFYHHEIRILFFTLLALTDTLPAAQTAARI
jgi:putative inorganic carbon (HCO3(-)) transporter